MTGRVNSRLDYEARLRGLTAAAGDPAPLVLALVIDQTLGDGEVTVEIAGDSTWRIRESVLTGIWRCCQFNAARTLVADWLEAAPLPRIVLAAARATARLPLVTAGFCSGSAGSCSRCPVSSAMRRYQACGYGGWFTLPCSSR